ncbi:MAG: hypothetical protein A2275_11860 [Bacteroidetes bacterium RIFOXYA12_FULL_35_11]|nr:MAG: hypothetical protein A2X01_17695 [Bacteroidetes bacterium GWF2_35_48]OFY83018.1 MAG: hypothetical protein A2275_11860 [Bacteroidetes bacterium RIFOXYA12_FULL_35_11]OFY95532.1 MAG: hypothetical protein A2491_05705 [Bacteroidetes bacterium RIFOXYC12_FULL_35_7]HBX53589.1 ATPase [Bacteroidales bacterium]
MIKREKYLKKIKPFIDKPLIKAITGIRRCGKSVLLQQICDELLERGVSTGQIISINKELYEYDFIKNYTDLHRYVSSKRDLNSKKTYYVFVDEVQEIDQWEKCINSLLAENHYDLYISGSSARFLSSELATLISGRYVEFQIYTFSFSEFVELYIQKNTEGKTDRDFLFSEYQKYGGFPGLFSIEWEEIVLRQYLQSVFNTILLKDVITRNKVRDAAMLQRILFFLADNCGNITTAKNISDFLKSQKMKISPETVQNYIQFALDAYLLIQSKRYDIKGKRLLELHEKYYMGDLGLLYAMKGFEPDMISARLENIVLHEMLTRGYQVKVGKNTQREVDFICEKGNDKIYLQVCKSLYEGNAYEREYKAYEGIEDFFPKYVLSLDQGFDTDKNGIKWMNIKDFLFENKI